MSNCDVDLIGNKADSIYILMVMKAPYLYYDCTWWLMNICKSCNFRFMSCEEKEDFVNNFNYIYTRDS